jgi:hypothetical protein
VRGHATCHWLTVGGKAFGMAAGGCRELCQAGWQYAENRKTNRIGAPAGNPSP